MQLASWKRELEGEGTNGCEQSEYAFCAKSTQVEVLYVPFLSFFTIPQGLRGHSRIECPFPQEFSRLSVP